MQALLTSMCSCSAPINLNGACAKIPVMEAHGLGMATSNFATFSDALKKTSIQVAGRKVNSVHQQSTMSCSCFLSLTGQSQSLVRPAQITRWSRGVAKVL